MFEEYKNKIELHCHSSGFSACSELPASEIIRCYRSAGYQGIVLTNHFYPWLPRNDRAYKKYIEEFIEEYNFTKELGEGVDIKVYLGLEIRFEENMNDYLLYGIDEDFVRGIPRKLETVYDFIPYLREHKDVLFIQAHPFRNGMYLVDSSLLDGIEVFNMHPNHNSRVGFAAKYADSEGFAVSTCGSDLHHPGQDALSALLTKKLPENEKELVKCMREEQVYKVGNSIVCFNN